ncbi:hypothetical protein FRC06_003208 [Ceratobasidium sp. 370]|nr:hypothetical protein FRC06_003208 [Ceratobasidium sp. 370]
MHPPTPRRPPRPHPRPPSRLRIDSAESESESESEPNPTAKHNPTISSRSKPFPSSSQQAKVAHSKPVAQPPKLSAGPPPPSQASYKNTTTTPVRPRPMDRPSHHSAHPPPNDLGNIDEVVIWALKLAEEQARVLNQNPSAAGPSSVPRPTSTTVDHVTQAIAKHRSQLNESQRVGSLDRRNRPTQATRASTPNDEDTHTGNGARTAERTTSKHSKKAKLSDFPGHVGDVASAAILRFLATVFADGSYEDIDTFRNWALDAYQKTWDVVAPEHEYEAPPKAVLTIMARRASWLRGKVKERIRAIIQYGFGFRNPAVNRKDVKHNRRLAEKLTPTVFHCRDLQPNTGQYEHPEFIRAIGAGLFWDSEAIGLAYRDNFEPVPMPAAALILTMMQACIEEWTLGYYKPTELNVDKQKVHFESHLLGLYEYERVARKRLTTFRGQWFKAGVEYSGLSLTEENSDAVRPYTLASQVRPDTPPPESEEDRGWDYSDQDDEDDD